MFLMGIFEVMRVVRQGHGSSQGLDNIFSIRCIHRPTLRFGGSAISGVHHGLLFFLYGNYHWANPMTIFMHLY